jgi:hypothetical protein
MKTYNFKNESPLGQENIGKEIQNQMLNPNP